MNENIFHKKKIRPLRFGDKYNYRITWKRQNNYWAGWASQNDGEKKCRRVYMSFFSPFIMGQRCGECYTKVYIKKTRLGRGRGKKPSPLCPHGLLIGRNNRENAGLVVDLYSSSSSSSSKRWLGLIWGAKENISADDMHSPNQLSQKLLQNKNTHFLIHIYTYSTFQSGRWLAGSEGSKFSKLRIHLNPVYV